MQHRVGQILLSRHYSPHPTPHTQHYKPSTLNPEILNPKPSTLRPEPEIRKQVNLLAAQSGVQEEEEEEEEEGEDDVDIGEEVSLNVEGLGFGDDGEESSKKLGEIPGDA